VDRSNVKINVPTKNNQLLEKVVGLINENEEISTLWKILNVNALDRLEMTDHGPVHFQIVSNIALRLSRILKKNGVEFSLMKNYELSYEEAEVVIFLASVFHDLGMSIEREGHEGYSLIIANNLLRELLSFLDVKTRTIITSETLHAIISHRSGGSPLTLEAGIVRVADALDMGEGRSKIPYEAGKLDIHSISEAAIENVEIIEGKDYPVEIEIKMNNSAGLFQVDELLKKKIKGSGIEKYISVRASINSKTEKKLMEEIVIKG